MKSQNYRFHSYYVDQSLGIKLKLSAVKNSNGVRLGAGEAFEKFSSTKFIAATSQYQFVLEQDFCLAPLQFTLTTDQYDNLVMKNF